MEIISMKSFAKQLNNLTFTDYFYRLMFLARSVFKWENLPNGIEEKWIEKFLFSEGKCVFYNDEIRGLMIAQCVEDGTLNNYEEPISVSPAGIDIIPKPLDVGKECVLIRNNDDMIPTSFTLKLFAYRLAEISRTIDINIRAQKTPKLLVGSNKQLLTLKNIYDKWEGFEPVIYIDKDLNTDLAVKVLDTGAPIVFPELQKQKTEIWNECLTFLGINNANTEKRERLITDEVEANNAHIDLSAQCMLKAREKACEQINKIFRTNISVSLRREEELGCIPDIQNTSETLSEQSQEEAL